MGRTHTLPENSENTRTIVCVQLTHSTSLTKPRGSFRGDRFSRNPVIMIVLFWSKIFIQLFLSCGCCSNKGRKRGSRQSDVVSTANAAKKQGADSVLQSNFSSHQKGDPVSLAWKIKRSTRLIIFKKKTNINLNVLIRHLFFLFLNFQCRSALRWCWCSDGADTRVKSAKTRFAFDQNACRVFGYRKIMAKTKEKTFLVWGVFLLLREAYFPPSQVK